MLPDPFPFSEAELLSQWPMAMYFIFGIIFFECLLSLSFFLLKCMKDSFMGLGFFPPFLVEQKFGFCVSSFLNLWHSEVVHFTCAPFPVLCGKQCSYPLL
jgi:hypothetical protein